MCIFKSSFLTWVSEIAPSIACSISFSSHHYWLGWRCEDVCLSHHLDIAMLQANMVKTSRVSKQEANGGKDETARMLLNCELWSLCFCIQYITFFFFFRCSSPIIGAGVPPYLGVVETNMQCLLYICEGLVCFGFPRRPVWEDCEEEWEADASFVKTWGMSRFLVRILRRGGVHERVFFFKVPVTTCSARMPGETRTENEWDKGHNRENNRNNFPLSV